MASPFNPFKVTTNFKKIKSALNAFNDYRFSSKSFSQFGEDLIVNQILAYAGKKRCSYLDIGANDPCYLSNTYYFYRQGGSGCLVEPDPLLCKALRRKRPRDKVVNCGLGFSQHIERAVLYRMNDSVLNTFSKQEAHSIELNSGYRIIDEVDIELIPVNIFLEKYSISVPDFMSIDVEGLDLQIIKNMNFARFRPLVVMAETLTFNPSTGGNKITEIIDIMRFNGYRLFADTRCNSIFVDLNRLSFS
jgi:FkbM family methyltransferase